MGVAWERARNYRHEQETEFMERYGTDLADPMAGLKKKLKDDEMAGRLSSRDYERVTNEIIPGYLGTLGQDTHPMWRKAQQYLMVYQSLRVLSTGIFAQFVDAGLVAHRAESGYRKQVLPLMRELMNKEGRTEMMRVAKELGVWQRDMLQHVVTDTMGALSMDSRTARVQELFFRYNGMHFATNFARMMSANLGRRLFKMYAEDGRADLFAELNVSLEEAQAWLNDGMPLGFGKGHDNVNGALHQFVDESVMFPDPATRPRLGNDKRFQLFFHLKSFMWAFTNNVLMRVYNQGLSRFRSGQGMAKAAAVLPAASLAAFTMPLAMLGMEMRWMITDPNRRPATGSMAYYFEAFQRAGLTGYAQLGIDANLAEEHGRSALFAVGGPAVSHFEELGTSGPTANSLERSLPAYPILGALRDLARAE